LTEHESVHGWLRIYLRTDARADSLLVGVALALAPWERMVAAIPGSLRTLLGALAAAALVVAAQLLDPSSAALYLGGFTLLAAIAAVLIAVVLRSDSALGRVLSSAPLVWLGRISYSLYLWHFPVFLEVGRRAAAWPAAARVVVGWSLAIGLAAASYRLIELPILRLKRRVRGSSQLGEAGSGSRGDADMAPARS
jgi:peptidoglycan/LPS O-acetylase OafA/YrhL